VKKKRGDEVYYYLFNTKQITNAGQGKMFKIKKRFTQFHTRIDAIKNHLRTERSNDDA
jgi:hypothetical protein